jgi:hypothetical protein
MSTMGREANRAADQGRQHRRRLEASTIRLTHALGFAINTLQDPSIADGDARSAALKVLTRWRP